MIWLFVLLFIGLLCWPVPKNIWKHHRETQRIKTIMSRRYSAWR